MDTKTSALTTEHVEDARPPAPPAPPRPATVGTEALLGTGHAALLGIGWPVVWLLATLLEPPAPNPHVPVAIEILSIALTVALGMLMVTAAARKPVALRWAGAIGGVLLFSAIACPVSGHHPNVGAWWFGQMALIGGMVATTAWVAMDRRRSTGDS